MALNSPNQDELDLRRRSRRRLIGAIALALAAVVVLPMIFDPEPKPLGSNVDIQIPEQAVPPPAAPVASGAAIAVPPPEARPPSITSPAAEPRVAADKPEPQASARVESKPKAKPRTETKPAVAPAPAPKPPASKVENEVDKKVAATGKTAANEPTKVPSGNQPAAPSKAETKPAQVDAATGDGKVYYLQLGSFASEANARQSIDKARKAGFKSDAMPVDGKFKVRVGPIAGRERALDYQGKLKAKGFDPVLVGP